MIARLSRPLAATVRLPLAASEHIRRLSFSQPQVSISGDTKNVVITPGTDKDGKPLPPATAVCFFLHGLGDSASSFAGMFHQLAIRMPHVKFVLPTAKPMKVTVNQGAEMPSWYDLHGISNRTAEQCQGIDDTRALLDHMIGMEIEGGISERRIVLGGFSQGGDSALYTGIRQRHGLAGLAPKTRAVSARRFLAPILSSPSPECHCLACSLGVVGCVHNL
jgi:poly(3-hydroxybutyrate) depolymerase